MFIQSPFIRNVSALQTAKISINPEKKTFVSDLSFAAKLNFHKDNSVEDLQELDSLEKSLLSIHRLKSDPQQSSESKNTLEQKYLRTFVDLQNKQFPVLYNEILYPERNTALAERFGRHESPFFPTPNVAIGLRLIALSKLGNGYSQINKAFDAAVENNLKLKYKPDSFLPFVERLFDPSIKTDNVDTLVKKNALDFLKSSYTLLDANNKGRINMIAQKMSQDKEMEAYDDGIAELAKLCETDTSQSARLDNIKQKLLYTKAINKSDLQEYCDAKISYGLDLLTQPELYIPREAVCNNIFSSSGCEKQAMSYINETIVFADKHHIDLTKKMDSVGEALQEFHQSKEDGNFFTTRHHFFGTMAKLSPYLSEKKASEMATYAVNVAKTYSYLDFKHFYTDVKKEMSSPETPSSKIILNAFESAFIEKRNADYKPSWEKSWQDIEADVLSSNPTAESLSGNLDFMVVLIKKAQENEFTPSLTAEKQSEYVSALTSIFSQGDQKTCNAAASLACSLYGSFDDAHKADLNSLLKNVLPKQQLQQAGNDIRQHFFSIDKDYQELFLLKERINKVDDHSSADYKCLRKEFLLKEYDMLINELVSPDTYKLNLAVYNGLPPNLLTLEPDKALKSLQEKALLGINRQLDFLSHFSIHPPTEKIVPTLFSLVESPESGIIGEKLKNLSLKTLHYLYYDLNESDKARLDQDAFGIADSTCESASVKNSALSLLQTISGVADEKGKKMEKELEIKDVNNFNKTENSEETRKSNLLSLINAKSPLAQKSIRDTLAQISADGVASEKDVKVKRTAIWGAGNYKYQSGSFLKSLIEILKTGTPLIKKEISPQKNELLLAKTLLATAFDRSPAPQDLYHLKTLTLSFLKGLDGSTTFSREEKQQLNALAADLLATKKGKDGSIDTIPLKKMGVKLVLNQFDRSESVVKTDDFYKNQLVDYAKQLDEIFSGNNIDSPRIDTLCNTLSELGTYAYKEVHPIEGLSENELLLKETALFAIANYVEKEYDEYALKTVSSILERVKNNYSGGDTGVVVSDKALTKADSLQKQWQKDGGYGAGSTELLGLELVLNNSPDQVSNITLSKDFQTLKDVGTQLEPKLTVHNTYLSDIRKDRNRIHTAAKRCLFELQKHPQSSVNQAFLDGLMLLGHYYEGISPACTPKTLAKNVLREVATSTSLLAPTAEALLDKMDNKFAIEKGYALKKLLLPLFQEDGAANEIKSKYLSERDTYISYRNQYVKNFDDLDTETQNWIDLCLIPYRSILPALCKNDQSLFIVDDTVTGVSPESRAFRAPFGEYMDAWAGMANQRGLIVIPDYQFGLPSTLGASFCFAHEFGHQLHYALMKTHQADAKIIDAFYQDAGVLGRQVDQYAASHPYEYFAQAQEAYLTPFKPYESLIYDDEYNDTTSNHRLFLAHQDKNTYELVEKIRDSYNKQFLIKGISTPLRLFA